MASVRHVDTDSLAARMAPRLRAGIGAAEAASVIENWKAAVSERVPGELAVAGPFQRKRSARHSGLPSNFCLVLSADEALALEFDPRHQQHPVGVHRSQIGEQARRWPRGSIRVAGVEGGRLASGVTFVVDGHGEIACRTPRLSGNPAAAAVVVALGGELP